MSPLILGLDPAGGRRPADPAGRLRAPAAGGAAEVAGLGEGGQGQAGTTNEGGRSVRNEP